jgi:hypothetical protein
VAAKEGGGNSNKEKRRGLDSSTDSAWMKIGVIATVLGALFAFISVAFALHWPPFDSSPSSPSSTAPRPSSPGSPTVSEVRAALLKPSGLASIDPKLIAADVAEPVSTSCPDYSANLIVGAYRQYRDGNDITLDKGIEIFKSPSVAHTAFVIDARDATCHLPSSFSSSNISSQLPSYCNETTAIAVTAHLGNNVALSTYLEQVRCGRMIVFFYFGTPERSRFDNNDNLNIGMEIALPKAQAIP